MWRRGKEVIQATGTAYVKAKVFFAHGTVNAQDGMRVGRREKKEVKVRDQLG